MSTTEHYSKEHSKDTKLSEEHSTETKRSTEHYTANQGKTEVVIERVQNAPVIVEHHRHNIHTVVHPEVVREHDTTEIRQVVQPVYEHVKTDEKVEYAGKDVKVVEKAEDITEAKRKLEAHHKDILAQADVTHTKDRTMTYDTTKERDIHAAHKVIEEVTPVIIRDVEHNKTIHKDEKLVEKIHHAPEVIKEEKEIKYKEGHTKETHGLKNEEIHTHVGLNEGHTKDTDAIKHKEGHTKDTHGIKHKKGHTKETHDLKHKEGHTKETKATHGSREKHTTKDTKLE
jgi:hypothetical protein